MTDTPTPHGTAPATNEPWLPACPSCARMLTECLTDADERAFVCFNSNCNNLRVIVLRPTPTASSTTGSGNAPSEKQWTCVCGGDIGVVIEAREGRWGDWPPVVAEDRRSKCQSCGEEWYDPAQADQRTINVLKATLAALRSSPGTAAPTGSSLSLEAFATVVTDAKAMIDAVPASVSAMAKMMDRLDGLYAAYALALTIAAERNEATLLFVRDIRRLLSALATLQQQHAEQDARVAAMTQDLEIAAGECLVECPEPGTPLARVVSANMLLKRERERLDARVAELEAALATFVDDDECSLDHHGNCQMHSLGNPCNVAVARRLLAARSTPSDGTANG